MASTAIAEIYENRLYLHDPRIRVARYWVGHWLIGGSLLDEDDWTGLVMNHGVEYCLNVETEHDDRGKLPDDRLCQAQTPDDGSPFNDAMLRRIADFMGSRFVNSKGYIHCQMGGSRSPAVAYFLLRYLCRNSREDALKELNKGFLEREELKNANPKPYGWHPVHRAYLESVDAWVEKNPKLE